MSILKQILNNPNPIGMINDMQSLSIEIIPVLLFFFFGPDESKQKSAHEALLTLARNTDLMETTNVIRPNNQKSDGTLETRILYTKPQDLLNSTYPMIEYLVALFTNHAHKFEDNLRNDALDLFQQIFQSENFLPTKKILLDVTNFILLFVQSIDPLRQQSYNLLNRIKEIAQIHCEFEALIAIQSVFYLFPE